MSRRFFGFRVEGLESRRLGVQGLGSDPRNMILHQDQILKHRTLNVKTSSFAMWIWSLLVKNVAKRAHCYLVVEEPSRTTKSQQNISEALGFEAYARTKYCALKEECTGLL